MKLSALASTLSALPLLAVSLFATSTIRVPADQPTIQAGINAANPGDTVLVAPGTYKENIDFSGKAITVKSSGGPKVTVIDGSQFGPVVTFAHSEGLKSTLVGFTLQNGMSTFNSSYAGGGIYIAGSSPTITNNVVQNNLGCSDGAGIAISFGSPRIQGNTIRNNVQSGCSGGPGGGGIAVLGAGSAKIIGNRIEKNTWGGNGGGIALFAAGTPTIMNNVIDGNSSSGGQGGGMWIVNDSDALIIQNLFYGNTASQGGAIYFLVPSGSKGPTIVNNTIRGANGVAQGSAIFAGGFDNQTVLYNNLLIGLVGQNAVFCDSTYSTTPPTFTNNDAYSANGSGLSGTCASQSEENGNISLNPQFVNGSSGNFHLTAGSPAINSGDNSAPGLPTKDLDGNARISGGTVDMGAYEVQQ